MWLEQIIHELRGEIRRINQAIERLEGMHKRTANKSLNRRGRKRDSLSWAERIEISKRMKKYWARRRAARESTIMNELSTNPLPGRAIGSGGGVRNRERNLAAAWASPERRQ